MKQPNAWKARVLKDPRVREAWAEQCGGDDRWSYWVLLKQGWQAEPNTSVHCVHEDTVRATLDALKHRVCVCHCEDCQPVRVVVRDGLMTPEERIARRGRARMHSPF